MKKILFFLIPFFLFVSLAGCAAKDKRVIALVTGEGAALTGMNAPPALTVLSGDQKFQIRSGTYTWNYGGLPIHADGLFVFDSWLDGDLVPLSADPGTALELRFETMPDRVTVLAWKAECATGNHSRVSESINLPVTDNTFTIPSDGEYLYEIAAEWNEEDGFGGEAVYAFAITNEIDGSDTSP